MSKTWHVGVYEKKPHPGLPSQCDRCKTPDYYNVH